MSVSDLADAILKAKTLEELQCLVRDLMIAELLHRSTTDGRPA